MVEAGDELDDGGLEGVVGGEGEEDAEAAWVEGRGGGRLQGDVPGVDGGVGGEGDDEAFGGRLGDFGEFLEEGGMLVFLIVCLVLMGRWGAD